MGFFKGHFFACWAESVDNAKQVGAVISSFFFRFKRVEVFGINQKRFVEKIVVDKIPEIYRLSFQLGKE